MTSYVKNTLVKKSIAFILVNCMLFAGTTVFATDDSQNPLTFTNGDTYLSEEDISETQAETDARIAHGRSLIVSGTTTRETLHLRFDLLRQDDPDWADEALPCHNYHTYGKMGCAMTSYAMVFNHYGDNDTPVTVANDYYDAYLNESLPCNFSASDMIDLRSLSRGASDSGLGNNTTDRRDMESVVVSSIYDGSPVVLRMRNGGKMHFVVAEGYYVAPGSSSVTIYINDPESDIDYSTVGEYYRSGWYVDSYVTVQ